VLIVTITQNTFLTFLFVADYMRCAINRQTNRQTDRHSCNR